jgi:hypothetical protein
LLPPPVILILLVQTIRRWFYLAASQLTLVDGGTGQRPADAAVEYEARDYQYNQLGSVGTPSPGDKVNRNQKKRRGDHRHNLTAKLKPGQKQRDLHNDDNTYPPEHQKQRSLNRRELCRCVVDLNPGEAQPVERADQGRRYEHADDLGPPLHAGEEDGDLGEHPYKQPAAQELGHVAAAVWRTHALHNGEDQNKYGDRRNDPLYHPFPPSANLDLGP